jgi:CHAD domain-containing protein
MNGKLMAYRFDKGHDSVQDGVQKIATELIDKAIVATRRRNDRERTVHNLRKTCKKLRGLIRLVRPVFADYETENAAFRDAGRGLSHLRDTAVLIQTYDDLLDTFEDQVDRAQFAPVRRHLTMQHRQLARHADVARQLEEFRERMTAARGRVERWRLDEKDFDAIEPGLAKCYKAARRAMAVASKDSSAEAIHDWRKRVKDHWYHADLLTPIWPKQMKISRTVAKNLSELLGQHHDLEVFVAHLAEHELTDAADGEALLGLARQKQRAIADKAFPLGARLLAEPTAHMTGRWRSYWNTWRSDEPREAALAA